MGAALTGTNGPDHYLVIDLEATCDDGDAIPRGETEIIEIGAVMVEARQLRPVDEWQSFVRPVRHPELTPFCTQLTSIRQEDVDTAPGFVDAWAALRRWLDRHRGVIWGSWGSYDRNQLRRDCSCHGVAYDLPDHLNFKNLFAEHLELKRPCGVTRALRICELELLGTHHRGIDDARNIARLLPWALGRRPHPNQ